MRIILIGVFGGVTIVIIALQIDEWRKLQSLTGVFGLIAFGYLFSYSSKNVGILLILKKFQS